MRFMPSQDYYQILKCRNSTFSGLKSRLIQRLWFASIFMVFFVLIDTASAVSEGKSGNTIEIDIKGKSCIDTDCHDTMQTKKVLHGPVAQGSCEPCHEQPREDVHVFRLTHEEDELCSACHLMPMKNYLHQPVREGNCTGCHDPHQSNYRFMLVSDPAQQLCLDCHQEDEFMQRQYQHGPVAAGTCIICHEPHSAWNPSLMIRPEQELCMFCHDDVQQRMSLVRHVHEPAQQDCAACHDPHASDYPMQMRQSTEKMCQGCHEDIAQLIENSTHVHSAVSDEQGCSNCHSGHASMLPRLLSKPLLDSCLSCHNREIAMEDGTKLTNMAQLLENNPEQHGPVRRADCSACHNPHASANFRLLIRDYPQSFYAPFDIKTYDLCFQCHISEMITVQEGKGLTRFKNGDLNLHYVHVNKELRGRTCRACHEVHASKKPAHIREKVPYGTGGWEYAMNFEQTSTGGKCLPGCHQEKEYIREPADIPIPKPREEIPTSETALQMDKKSVKEILR